MNIFVDIDGILTKETKGFDYIKRTLNIDNAIKIRKLSKQGHNIVLFTSRDIADKKVTVQWLKENYIRYDDIIFNKPKYDLLIDDKARSNF
jgi:hypothetical protein